jgi:hypothetical protein
MSVTQYYIVKIILDVLRRIDLKVIVLAIFYSHVDMEIYVSYLRIASTTPNMPKENKWCKVRIYTCVYIQ